MGLAHRRSSREASQPMPPPTDLEVVMDFDPEEGIANLDDYLDTLKRAAEAQGF